MLNSNLKLEHALNSLSEKLNGYSFSEVEDFFLDILRQSILFKGKKTIKSIVSEKLKQLNRKSNKVNARK